MENETVGLISGKSSQKKTKAIAFFLCILCCLSAGSVQLYSIYTPALQHKLGYNQLQINAISVSAELGMYLPVPILGYLGDKYGQAFMASFGGATLIPGYALASAIYQAQGSYKYLAVCWAFIGCGTSCLFFCGLVTCARIYPNVTGLAISAPVAAFGVSSLWETQLIRSLFVNGADSEVNVQAVFAFFAVLYVIGSGCGIAAAKLAKVEPVEQDKTSEDDHNVEDGNSSGITGEDNQIGEGGYTSDGAVSSNGNNGPLSQRDRLIVFLKNPETWLFFLVFVVTIGPLEMYVVNMGAIIDTIEEGPDVSFHVALFSFASTVARLGIGILSDMLQKHISRPLQLASVFFVTALCHFMLANGVLTEDNGQLFFVSSIVNGFSYGVTFTLVPTVVACVWGVQSFGTNWGMFILAPAIGSTMFGMLFGTLYEKASKEVVVPVLDVCSRGYLCFSWTFILTGLGMLLASLVTTGLWVVRWKNTVDNL